MVVWKLSPSDSMHRVRIRKNKLDPKPERRALKIHKGSVTRVLLQPLFSNLVLVTSTRRTHMRKIVV